MRFLHLNHSVSHFLRSVFSLAEGTDAQGTVSDVRNNVRLRGANFWILICSAGLASIGLDVNSVAIIIGAMLISPLMSPILGIGLGIGINDRDLLVDSLKNFGIAVAASMAASTLYFLLTPLGEPTTELVSRTEPTLLDVGVALFGGVAGIVAGSRRHKTNVLPGVAIATALMPPLCSAGFGLATGRWAFFFGAFYLFFINAFCISLSTYIVVRLLNFPYHEFPDERTKRFAHHWIVTFSIIVMAPSVIILYGVIKDLRAATAVGNFVDDHLRTESYEPIRTELQKVGDSIKYLKVYMAGAPIRQRVIDSLSQTLEHYGLGEYRLKIIQISIPEEERKRLAQEATMNVLKTIEMSQIAQKPLDGTFDSIAQTIERPRADTIPLRAIVAELDILLPEVEGLAYLESTQNGGDTTPSPPIFLYQFSRTYGQSRQRMVRERLEAFLRQRTRLDTLVLRRLVE